MAAVAVGTRATVRVPATSANLGTGFDCMGVALDWYDELTVEVIPSGLEFELSGEGVDEVPRTPDHLVVRTLHGALTELGPTAGGLRLTAHGTIPHARGLGSSAAAIVAALALAWSLARPGEGLDLDWLDDRATRIEGHPDNVVAAVRGGAILAWSRDDGVGVVQLDLVDGLRARVHVPAVEVSTSGARKVLPDSVPRTDAVAQATRSALLVHALTRDPSYLLEATDDLLHQRQRAPLMPAAADLVARLRGAGVAAMVSGAGPTVLALGTAAQLASCAAVASDGFEVHDLALGRGVEVVAPSR